MPPRQPVERLYRGLVGRPYQPPETPPTPPAIAPVAEAAAVPAAVPRKRGRPQIHADPNAAKLASKKKLRQQDTVPLIEAILRRLRGYQSKLAKGLAGETRAEIIRNSKEQLAKLKEELLLLPHADVRVYYDRLCSRHLGISDSAGRLQGERSGEAPQRNGMSEMENIIATIQREDGELPAKPVGPSGHGADASEDNRDEDDGDAPALPLRVEYHLEDAVERVADEVWNSFDVGSTVASIPIVYDDRVIRSLSELKEHVTSRFREGQKTLQKLSESEEAFSEMLLPVYVMDLADGFVKDMRKKLTENLLFHRVNIAMDELQKESRQQDRKTRRLERLGREIGKKMRAEEQAKQAADAAKQNYGTAEVSPSFGETRVRRDPTAWGN